MQGTITFLVKKIKKPFYLLLFIFLYLYLINRKTDVNNFISITNYLKLHNSYLLTYELF